MQVSITCDYRFSHLAYSCFNLVLILTHKTETRYLHSLRLTTSPSSFGYSCFIEMSIAILLSWQIAHPFSNFNSAYSQNSCHEQSGFPMDLLHDQSYDHVCGCHVTALSIHFTFTELFYLILLLFPFTARKNDDYTLWQRNICYENSHVQCKLLRWSKGVI